MADTKLARIRSIDLLRGADVLLMLFVNEVAGVAGAPAFLRHKGAADDGMTITDLVFPAFLFVVGMAIPFALGSRLRARREPARGAAPRGRARGRPRRDRRADGERGARRRGVGVAARLERADDARRAARLGPAARAAGAGVIEGLAPSPRHPALALRGAGVPRQGRQRLAAAAALLVGDPRAHRLGVPGCRQPLPRGRRRGPRDPDGTRRRSTAASRSPTRRAVSAGRRFRGRSWAASSGRTARSCSRAACSASWSSASSARSGSPWRFAARGARLRRGVRRGGTAAPHAPRPPPPRSRSARSTRRCRGGSLSAALTTAAWVAIFVIGGRAGPAARGRRPSSSPARTRCSPTCWRRSCCRSSSSPAPLFGGAQPLRGAQPAGAALGLVRSAVFAWVVVRLTGWLRARGLRFQL